MLARATPAGETEKVTKEFVNFLQQNKINAKPSNLHQIVFQGACGGLAYAEARVNPITNTKFVEVIGSFEELAAIKMHAGNSVHIGDFQLKTKLVHFESLGYAMPCIEICKLPMYVFI